MKIMIANAEGFLFNPNGFVKKLNPLTRRKNKIIRQYLNLESIKRAKRNHQPDLMIVNQIMFSGVGDIPQIDLINNDLLQRKTQFNHYISYRDRGNFSTCLFGNFNSKTINLTESSYCLETQVGDISILSINLSKRKKTRQEQLSFIEVMIERNIHRKYLVVGQFNIKRERELSSLISSCSLFNLPLNPTYPKLNPKEKSLRILYHNDIRVFGSRTIDTDFSNHHSVLLEIGN